MRRAGRRRQIRDDFGSCASTEKISSGRWENSIMWEAPIVKKVHEIRERLAAEHDFELKALFASLYKHQALLADRLLLPKNERNHHLKLTGPPFQFFWTHVLRRDCRIGSNGADASETVSRSTPALPGLRPLTLPRASAE